jgi:hypothetical protein
MAHQMRECLFWALMIVVLGAVLLTPRTNADRATKILQQQGYTDIEITGWRPFMAAEEDWQSTGFRARGPAGEEVTGAVTGGVFKGHVIRLD